MGSPMSPQLPKPAVFMVDGCVIDLQDVAAVFCAVLVERGPVPVCTVILKSGVSFNIDMQYSRALIQAVEWSRSPGSVARPKDGLLDEGERIDNAWIVN